MNDPVSSDPVPSEPVPSDPSTRIRGLTLPPLDHGDDDWAAPITRAGRRSVAAAWVLLGLTVAGVSFAAGARIGRDRAPETGPAAFLRAAGLGGPAGGFGGGQAGSGGSAAGTPRGSGRAAATDPTVSTAMTGTQTTAAADGSAPADAAPPTSAPTDQALAGLLPGFDAPPVSDALPASGAPPASDAPPPAGSTTELGRVSAVEGRTVTVTGADGQRVVFRLPDGVAVPAVGSPVRAG